MMVSTYDFNNSLVDDLRPSNMVRDDYIFDTMTTAASNISPGEWIGIGVVIFALAIGVVIGGFWCKSHRWPNVTVMIRYCPGDKANWTADGFDMTEFKNATLSKNPTGFHFIWKEEQKELEPTKIFIKGRLIFDASKYPGRSRAWAVGLVGDELNFICKLADDRKRMKERLKVIRSDGDNKCSLKMYVPRPAEKEMRDRRTSTDCTLWDIIAPAISDRTGNILPCATDESTYVIFKDLFDRILTDYHPAFPIGGKHQMTNLSDHRVPLVNIDPNGVVVRGGFIACRRNLAGYKFGQVLNWGELEKLERDILAVLETIPDHKGKYTRLEEIPSKNWSGGGESGKYYTYDCPFPNYKSHKQWYPKCRGVFTANCGKWFVLVNEYDHVRIIVKFENGDVETALTLLIGLLQALEKKIVVQGLEKHVRFARSDHFGWLTCDPRFLGSAMTAGVFIRKDKESIRRKLDADPVDIREVSGENLCLLRVAGQLGQSETDVLNSVINLGRRVIE